MNLTGLHLLLTYKCTFECDHCFTWGSPWQSGVMTLANIHEVLYQAQDLGTIKTIYFEGGEPFLYYAALLQGSRESAHLGFHTGIVTNGFWATTVEDALNVLSPFAGLIQDLSISSDLFHGDEVNLQLARNAIEAANRLGILVGMLSIARPERTGAPGVSGQLPIGESKVMFRGRAAEKLSNKVPGAPWDSFTTCPHENLREPGRVHLDPFGNLHLCQGISFGNLFLAPLAEVCQNYDPNMHPVAGPLLTGGPAELVRRYDLPHGDRYADACHLCYSARLSLRARFPEALTPDAMYGEF